MLDLDVKLKKLDENYGFFFLSNITWKNPMTQVWAKFKRVAGKFKPSLPPLLKLNGSYILDPKLVSDIFADHFAKVSSKDENKLFFVENA